MFSSILNYQADACMDLDSPRTTQKSKKVHVRTFEDHPTVWASGARAKTAMVVQMLCNLSFEPRRKTTMDMMLLDLWFQ